VARRGFEARLTKYAAFQVGDPGLMRIADLLGLTGLRDQRTVDVPRPTSLGRVPSRVGSEASVEVSQMSRRILTTAAAAIALLCLGGTTAMASTPVSGAGTFQLTLAPVSTRSVDGNTFINFTFHETISGSWSGTRVGHGDLVIHPDGTVNVSDSGVFTGTVAGSAPGTAILSAEASGTFSAVSAQGVIGDGTAGLTGVHGQAFVTGAATGPTSFAGTYTGRAQFGAP